MTTGEPSVMAVLLFSETKHLMEKFCQFDRLCEKAGIILGKTEKFA